MLSDRFKSMYRQMGLDRPAAAKLLRVSERTLHNWETGVHEIPYSAYKLLRLLSYSELPGAWSGWHIAVGRLWSPEGHSFKPDDSSWWSLLCRRAAGFDTLYRENSQLRLQASQPSEGYVCPVTRKVSLTDATNQSDSRKESLKPCPAKVRYNLPKTLFATTVKGGGNV
jgi:DNA-binding XRE family transcriptional regulator